MNTGDTVDLADRANRFDERGLGFELLIGRGRDASQQRVRDVHARYAFSHARERLGAAERAEADDDGGALVQFARTQLAHEIGKQRHIEAELRLNELRPGRNLIFEIVDALAIRRRKRICGGAEEELG